MWRRRLKFAAALAVPLVLYLVIAEQMSWRPRTLANLGKGVTAIAISPEGATLVAFNTDVVHKPQGELRMLNLRDLTVSRRDLAAKPGRAIEALTFSPDASVLVGTSFYPWHTMRRKLNFWDASSGKLRRQYALRNESQIQVAFWPDAQTITVVGGYSVETFAAGSGQRLHEVRHAFGNLSAVAFAPDGQILAGAWAYPRDVAQTHVAAPQSPVFLWHAATGALKGKLPCAQYAMALAFAPDGKTLAVGGADGEVGLWDVKTRRLKRTLQNGKRPITGVAFMPDGKKIVVVSFDSTVKLWRVR